MGFLNAFLRRQMAQMRLGGKAEVVRKLQRVPLYALALINLLIIRIIRPVFLIRFSPLHSQRLGHLCANTEQYLCERHAGLNLPEKNKFYLDVFYMENPVCNQQLTKMWKSVLCIWPAWLLGPIDYINRLIPGGAIHVMKDNIQEDRDVLGLLSKYSPSLNFTSEEIEKGELELQKMGIPSGAKIVCLNVRDSSYLYSRMKGAWSSHDYRDCDVQSYVLAAEELAERGYYVLRMGASVLHPIKSSHSKVIDYATKGMRSDFMDIYLGHRCTFCISSGSGWDSVPVSLFRKPTVYTNFLPVGYFPSYSDKNIFITRHHVLIGESRELSLREIFSKDLGLCLDALEYSSKNIKLVENSPEEIRDVVLEMQERLDGKWVPLEEYEVLQRQFWKIYPVNLVSAHNGKPLHGEFYARCGSKFLHNNQKWVQ